MKKVEDYLVLIPKRQLDKMQEIIEMYKKEPNILRLVTPEGFNEAFEERLPDFKTYQEAYESVERLHNAHFGRNKYKDYESFRTIRGRILKKK